ncbi:MAG: LytTR family DNA-binding domain-containing protein [Rhodocyclaceae bacterium]|nr:LytTR family DNA-binding domain-containing protein [Rhodocyclaceae bacterium]
MKRPSLLIVDDEEPARLRLASLLSDLRDEFPHTLIGAARDGVEALEIDAAAPADIVLTDIRMPRMDGLELAKHLATRVPPPAIVFVTAYDEFALQAFELAAVDYLLKPVTRARLFAALTRARRMSEATLAQLAPGGRKHLRVVERGHLILLPVEEILYFRAEDKYVVACTRTREYLVEDSLSYLEHEFAPRFLRIHRGCLVARDAVVGAHRRADERGEPQWCLSLAGVEEPLPVSRRQWPLVKEQLGLMRRVGEE